MKKIKEIPLDMRPRERLLKFGAKALSDSELLVVILGKGSKTRDVVSISNELLKIVDNGTFTPKADELMKIKGIGCAKAALISAAFEFTRRRIKPQGIKIEHPSDIIPLVSNYSDRKQEHFISVSINGAGEVINVRVVTIGLVNKTQVHPREVFADIISDRASAFIIAHNHPSGSLTPSDDDIKVTKMIKDSASILHIELLDHIIFTSKGYFSFLENKML